MYTVALATCTVPSPGGGVGGSLHVTALSPARAACFPLIKTVALPVVIVPCIEGGVWKLVPGGGTWLVLPPLPATAAGEPSIRTSALKPSVIRPLKGRGVGVGVVP